ncbi:MAG: von Willebrand factor type A domain-containing protein [archaeon]
MRKRGLAKTWKWFIGAVIAAVIIMVILGTIGILFFKFTEKSSGRLLSDSGMYSKNDMMTEGFYGGMPPPGMEPPNDEPYDTTFFENYGVNPFIATEDEAFSTFGMDVDTAAYTIVRRWIEDGNMPDKDSVRTEEFINYFEQDYPTPDDTFDINLEGAESHFGQPNYHLLRVGIKAREVSFADRKPANMVFVVDVSGSMDREDRLEAVKKSLRMLADQLKPDDKIGLVIYGSTGKKISDLTSDKNSIMNAIEELVSGGSTNAEQGLTIAYDMMREGFEPGKINRVILCSDGVANVGRTGADSILTQIKKDADKGITLTSLGFGMGNYNDVMMEKLANHGDGNYYYIDTDEEAQRLFSDGATSMLQVVASDAKIQVEFNPDTVDRFRLLGYENRRLEKKDFEDDTVDAGEVGAGQTVTALYELRIKDDAVNDASQKIADVHVRYLDIDTKEIKQQETSVNVGDMASPFDSASGRFRFTAAVAEFAEILKESYWAKDSTLEDVLGVAQDAIKDIDKDDKDTEFVTLVKKAMKIED